MTQRERWMERLVAAAFALTMLTGLALLAVYGLGGQTQVEGVLLAICLGALGFGIVVWAQELMHTPIAVEERHPLASQTPGPAVSEILDEEAGFTRRTLLVRMLLGALGGLAAALAIPALSLGPAPGRELFVTSWAPGRRLVDIDGVPVRAADLEIGSVATVFPEGDAGSAQAQTLLIRVEPDALRLSPDRPRERPRRVCRVLQGVHARRLPGRLVPGAGPHAHLSVPPVDLRCPAGSHPGLRAGREGIATTTHRDGRGRHVHGAR